MRGPRRSSRADLDDARAAIENLAKELEMCQEECERLKEARDQAEPAPEWLERSWVVNWRRPR
jgi:hypothetical protein